MYTNWCGAQQRLLMELCTFSVDKVVRKHAAEFSNRLANGCRVILNNF